MNSNLLRDKRNLDLIRMLLRNPRMAVSELARGVGMSAPAVRERLVRLEDAGVIQGYRLELGHSALGLPVTAYVRVRPASGQLPKLINLAQSIPEIVECHRVTGEDCLIIKVHLVAVENLDRILDRLLAHGQTTTSIVYSTPVPLRAPPLPDAPRNGAAITRKTRAKRRQ